MPFNLNSKEFAVIVSAFLGDGGISKRGQALYNNSELCMRKKLLDSIKTAVGKINIDPTKPYKNNSIIFPRILTSILRTGFNMQIGDKVINNPKIPKLFINTNNKKIIGAFLNQAFSDDGTVYIDKNKQGTIAYGISIDVTKIPRRLRHKIKKEKLEKYCSNLVKGCNILLNKLDIKVNGPYCKREYIRKKYGETKYIHSWAIQIQGKDSIKRFKRLVNFSIPRKSRKIKEILDNYTQIGYKISFKDSLERVKKLSKKNKKINTINLMKERKCTLENARYLLKELRKNGKIIIDNRIIQRNGRFLI